MSKKKLKQVREMKATGDYPAKWFRGYTRWTEQELDAVLAARDASPSPEPEPSEVDRGVPAGIAVTSAGYPVTVQVQATRTVQWHGGTRTFRRAELLRGETAWKLWDEYRTLVAPK